VKFNGCSIDIILRRLVGVIGGVALLFTAAVAGAEEKAPKKLDMRKVMRALESRKASDREAAVTALKQSGDDGARALAEGMTGKSASVRERYLGILMQLDGPGAKIAVADMAVFEKNRKLREKAVESMVKRHDKDVRAHLLDIVENKASGTRKKASEAIREVRDPVYVDALLSMLRRQLREAAGGDGGGALSLDVSSSDTVGRRTQSVSRRVGGKTVTQSSNTPVFRNAGVPSTAGLPAAQALVTVTGRNYGSNVRRWEAWWNENREDWAAGRR
jgi:hypothetical protein